MAVTEYVGARYVPKFSDINGGDWDNQYSYEALEIVKNGNDYYTSKIPVPPGVPISDTTYWALTGNYNGAISTLTSRVVAVEGDIVNINKFIAANDYFVTPEDYGAVADGVTDCTAAIQQAIDDNPKAPIYFNTGVYCISDMLVGKDGIHFIMAPDAIIRLTAATTCMVYNNIQDITLDPSSYNFDSYILGGKLDGQNNCQVVYGFNHLLGGVIRDTKIFNFTEAGIYAGYNVSGSGSTSGASNLLDNVYIEGSNALYNNAGIILDRDDNFLRDITVRDCKYGVVANSGGNTLNNVHPWISDDTYFAGSAAFVLNGVNKLIACTSDGPQTGIRIGSTGTWAMLSNFRFAFQNVSFATVQGAGGFKYFDVASGTDFRIIGDIIKCEHDITYVSDGKFVPDWVYQSASAFLYVSIKQIAGDSRLANVANVMQDPDSLDWRGIELQDSTDLNDVRYPGKYTTKNSTSANTITNQPVAMGTNFDLKVERCAGGVRQWLSYSTYAATYTVYSRFIQTAGSYQYGPWRKMGEAV